MGGRGRRKEGIMTRPQFHEQIGCTRSELHDLRECDARPRGLDALIPTAPPAPDVRRMQWSQLNLAFAAIRHAEFEFARGALDEGGMWLDDARRALGALALTLAEGPAAEGYARLFESILTPPSGASSECER
jgi:hypothetical protein